MEQILSGMNVAILVTDDFEQVELTGPREALDHAGASSKIISNKRGKVQGFNHDVKADQFDVDMSFDEADPDDFDAVLLPGGAINADQIRIIPQAQQFVQRMQQDGKPIAAICHGPWTLIETGVVRGRRMTSWPSLRTDLENAGAQWVDEEVVVDNGLVTSRKPSDIPAFNRRMIEEFAEGEHRGMALHTNGHAGRH